MNVVARADDQSLAHEGAKEIAIWAEGRRLDVVLWTDLPSNFADKVKKRFSVQEAIDYLGRLPAPAKAKAVEYIWRAPEFVRTPLRHAMKQQPWFHEREA